MPSPDRSVSLAKRHHNRVGSLMLHTSRYSCFPTSRLAHDSHVAKSTISHLVHGRTNPLYSTAARVVKCLERELHTRLECREVFTEDGTYPTCFVCRLAGCPGCTPIQIVDEYGSRKSKFKEVKPGQWTGDSLEFEDLPEGKRDDEG